MPEGGIDKEAARVIRNKAHDTLMLRHIMKPGRLLGCRYRPHTRVWLNVGEDKVDPLGIVFKRWSGSIGGITFTQKGVDGTIVRKADGQFANDRSGKEMGLIVPERWIWDDLLRTHKGLAYGNL